MRLFSDRKIATKIAIGFSAVLAIVVTISVIAYLAFSKVNHEFHNYAEQVAGSNVVGDIDRHFLAMRRYVGDVADAMEQNIAAADKERKEISALIAQAQKYMSSADAAAKLKHLAEQFEIYSKDFDKVTPKRREQVKLTATVIDPVGIKLRRDLDQLQKAIAQQGNAATALLVADANQSLMLMRLRGERAFSRHSAEDEKSANAALAELTSQLAALEKIVPAAQSAQLAQVKADVATFQSAFAKALEAAHEIDNLLHGEMRTVARALAADAEAIKAIFAAEEKREEQEASQTIAWANSLIIVLAFAGFGIGAVLAWIIGRGISVPIGKIGDVLAQLASGNKAVEVPFADRRDEVGDNARAAKTFKENLLRIEQMENEQKEAERRAAAQRKADMHRLADEFQAAVGGIIETVSSASTELEAAAATLTTTARSTQERSASVAAASEQASSNVQSVASATEELGSSVDEISRQVQESSRIAVDAVRQAQKTDSRINALSQAAGKIGDVVNLITAIAEQTNLLALNATIEAARAGEAGRGFAVVAAEVKSLANQTSKATDEIGSQISSMQAATQEAVSAIKEISATISRVSEISGTIAAAVEEQGAATREIARNVQEASQGTTKVAGDITQVSSGATETGSASAQVLSSAQSLSQESTHLKTEVDRFLVTVRAA
jgi:methyl-accepting chemotaxis protein